MSPTRDKIIDAMEDRTNCPSELQEYSTLEGFLSHPKYFQGGFALVFPLIRDNQKIALKIWYNDVENIAERMNFLAHFFNKNKFPFIINTCFYKNGFNVNGNLINALGTQWIDGLNLKEYTKKILEDNCADCVKKRHLQVLASKLNDVFREMHKYNMSHGDLQHTNIMVDMSNNIKLIDYDSFYIPQMGVTPKITVGFPAYQHPTFKTLKLTNEKVDYFSELII